MAMADGARARFGAPLAASITGVAGPDGGSDEKPVGLVVRRARHDERGADVRRFQFGGDRGDESGRGGAQAALEWLIARGRGARRDAAPPRSSAPGLAPGASARPIRPGERIHVLGIAGAGASAAALHAAARGAIVTGCDPGGPSPYTPALEAVGIPIAWSHNAGHVDRRPAPGSARRDQGADGVAPDHPELRAAANRGIPAEPWQQVIADAAYGRRLIAVAGTHGKSTTAGWLTWVLAEAGLDPSAFVGALLPAALTGGIPATARLGERGRVRGRG